MSAMINLKFLRSTCVMTLAACLLPKGGLHWEDICFLRLSECSVFVGLGGFLISWEVALVLSMRSG